MTGAPSAMGESEFAGLHDLIEAMRRGEAHVGMEAGERYHPRRDLTGMRFGRLVVVAYAGPVEYGRKRVTGSWSCRCDCGNLIDVKQPTLLRGGVRSCGCLRRENAKTLHRFNGRNRK